MVVVRQVRLADHIDAIGDLMRANWEETGFGFPFALDTSAYKRFEAVGLMFAVAAFDGEKGVVGYSTFSINHHPYNPDVLCCNSDALYVHPSYRNGTVASRLVLETERLAKEAGVDIMLWHTRGGTKFFEALERRGYEVADVVMMRRLSHGN